ncbi:MAG: 16S rRNA (uracil(1498)-N(3))-methyltransferase [Gammaproteobacteria bacterium]|uniref:16S rRNA (uracil(1498)-N(3))-methyltransferase n=1 Tax=Rhodoferax sp. TaxID=50421 RepID=UPI001826599F|nr:16S rRNA (uracil(1498)-N(3))-methyltransferase [Rhodoferax sp.]MBU3897368.1 16S rRNA (uracil(1498)-N(3))-methyltransferase [Gammaproteobacteria bacterium]MBA3058814.1 16S rRNA (uracil(1498)-N(3))-methyltransferase [Rhodoferax sp.]MBU3999247.1 16S rRNA (uracil(1498)-N(3))-methyltransferase [Gammaproteobacteria bacterium]MBU4018714.1 16S rRNA (uracil(1498)-N(3))-methyltransferase [Gammaproteobacteria bacterium]MBU4079669.1 16S rRNA (uracil(1498)-N(3))-methyltransferase [Gammaproteobacteria ba
MPRFYCPTSLRCGDLLDLPAGAARHVQVLRLQPGDRITLFNGGPGWDAHDAMPSQGGEFDAVVTRMGRSDVQVQVGDYHAVEREAVRQVHLAVGMPANDRMDWLVEKASELGVTSIQPLMTERSVLRLNPERAGKKQAHWQSVAVAASEQCGGNRVPVIHAVMTLAAWLKGRAVDASDQQLLLSFRPGAPGVRAAVSAGIATGVGRGNDAAITFLSGPEGGLSPAEEAAALSAGYVPVTLGPRVLRAETAALAALAALLT